MEKRPATPETHTQSVQSYQQNKSQFGVFLCMKNSSDAEKVPFPPAEGTRQKTGALKPGCAVAVAPGPRRGDAPVPLPASPTGPPSSAAAPVPLHPRSSDSAGSEPGDEGAMEWREMEGDGER